MPSAPVEKSGMFQFLPPWRGSFSRGLDPAWKLDHLGRPIEMLILHLLTNDPVPWPPSCWQSLSIRELPEGLHGSLSYVRVLGRMGAASTSFPLLGFLWPGTR